MMQWRLLLDRLHGPTIVVAAVIASLLALVPSPARAQAVTGTLLGTVTDTSGAAVPGATVTATETQTNVKRSTATNEVGHLHVRQPLERHVCRRDGDAGLQERWCGLASRWTSTRPFAST